MMNKPISPNRLLIVVAFLVVGLIASAGLFASVDQRSTFLGLSLLGFVTILALFQLTKWLDWVMLISSVLVYGVVQYSFHDATTVFLTRFGTFVVAVVFAFFIARAINLEVSYLINQYSSGNVLIEELTLHDALGLIKWRVFLKELKEEFIRSRRTEKPVSVLMIRLLNYADFVSEGNKERAEELIGEVAKISCEIMRTIDTISRYDQDTLGVILPETSEEDAKIAASRVTNGIAQRANAAASAGIASFPKDAVSVDKMISRALTALEFAISSEKEQVAYAQLNIAEEGDETKVESIL